MTTTFCFPSCQQQSHLHLSRWQMVQNRTLFPLHVPATAPAPLNIFFLKHLLFFFGLSLRTIIQNPSTSEPILLSWVVVFYFFWGGGAGKRRPAMQLGRADLAAKPPELFGCHPSFLFFAWIVVLYHPPQTDPVSLVSFTGGTSLSH